MMSAIMVVALQCFDIVDWVIVGHLIYKNLNSSSPEVLFLNKWMKIAKVASW